MIFLSLLCGVIAVMFVIALLRIAFDAGRGYLADEKWIMPEEVYLNLGSIKLEGGSYSVMLRPANEGEVRLYKMENVPPEPRYQGLVTIAPFKGAIFFATLNP